MQRNRFLKNLYQTISYALVIFIFVFILIMGFLDFLSHGSNKGWILLLIALILLVLFFIIGFYWVFQIVEIDENGIKTKILNKTIRNISWDSITEIKYASVMRNPAYVLKIKNERNLNLDSRKQIKRAIAYYGNDNIKNEIKKLTK